MKFGTRKKRLRRWQRRIWFLWSVLSLQLWAWVCTSSWSHVISFWSFLSARNVCTYTRAFPQWRIKIRQMENERRFQLDLLPSKLSLIESRTRKIVLPRQIIWLIEILSASHSKMFWKKKVRKLRVGSMNVNRLLFSSTNVTDYWLIIFSSDEYFISRKYEIPISEHSSARFEDIAAVG